MTNRYVVVTTKHRGVFMGKLINREKHPASITLGEAQMCIRFCDGKGVFGLASDGPDNCRISKPVEEQEIVDITSMAICSDEAVKKWKLCPWK